MSRVTAVALVVAAGCSSSNNATSSGAPPPYNKTGPHSVGVTSLDLGSAGPTLGERLYYSNLLAGIASWGYEVLSADYLERGLAAQALKLTTRPSTENDTAIMHSSLLAVERASGDPVSPLSGVVDPKRVAAVGHSAGVGTAFNALDARSVKTAVGWAPVPPTVTASSKPVMLIGTEGDSVVTPSTVTRAYTSFEGPKVLVEISGEGHNSYTDICAGTGSGSGLISYAISAGFVQAKLAKLGINGCQSSNIDPVRFWPIVHYYTVLQLENQLNPHPFGSVPSPAPGQFPGFTITITLSG